MPSIKLLYVILILCSAAVVIAGTAIHLQLKRHAKTGDEMLHKVFDEDDSGGRLTDNNQARP